MNDSQKLDRLLMVTGALLFGEGFIMAELDDLQAQVTQNTTIEESAVTLINGIAQKLADAIASGNPAALVTLKDELAKSATDLSAAIVANTPAAP